MRVALLPVAAHVREMVAAELVDEGSANNHMSSVIEVGVLDDKIAATCLAIGPLLRGNSVPLHGQARVMAEHPTSSGGRPLCCQCASCRCGCHHHVPCARAPPVMGGRAGACGASWIAVMTPEECLERDRRDKKNRKERECRVRMKPGKLAQKEEELARAAAAAAAVWPYTKAGVSAAGA